MATSLPDRVFDLLIAFVSLVIGVTGKFMRWVDEEPPPDPWGREG